MKSDVENKNEIKESLPTEQEIEAEALSNSFFKISKIEKPLFWVLCIMFFIISLVYSVIRDMKDALVLTRLNAASISYLKMGVVLPGNLIAIFIIQKLLSKTSVSRVFSWVTLFFSIFFMVYGLVLINFQDYIEPSIFLGIDPFSDGKMSLVGLEWTSAFYLIFTSYVTTCIYLFAELWGSCVLSFLFLSFTNSICTKKQNFRYTPLLLVSSNIALVLSGVMMFGISILRRDYIETYEWNRGLTVFVFVLLSLLSLSVYLIHWYFEKSILLKQFFIPSDNTKTRKRLKMGILEGLREVFSSKLVLSISFMVLAYSITVNMAESPFKSLMPITAFRRGESKENFVIKTNAINQILTGLIVTFIMLCDFSQLVHRLGWFFVASLLPILSTITALVFFPLIYINVKKDKREEVHYMFQPLMKNAPFNNLELYLGQSSVIMYKALKYAAFDICKEFISMTIDPVYRAHYKSIFDGVCGKLGKALGSLITSIQNAVMNTVDVRESSMFTLVVILLLNTLWILAIYYLARKYEKSIKFNKYIEDEKLFKN